MNILKKILEFYKYLGFNIFAIGGWLYLPALIYVLSFKYPYHYIWLPLGIFLLIPWFISTIAFLIFLIEQITSPKAGNKIFQNKIYRFMANTGLVVIFIFHAILLVKSLISL